MRNDDLWFNGHLDIQYTNDEEIGFLPGGSSNVRSIAVQISIQHL